MKNEKIINARIRGGNKLHGEILIAPNKNAILAAIAASILTKDTMTYHNIPMSPDVRKMLKALALMGAAVECETATVTICCEGVHTHVVPEDSMDGTQAVYLFVGPLLARFGQATITKTSGCRLGYRGHEDHAEYLKKVGVVCDVVENQITFTLSDDIRDNRILERSKLSYEKRVITYANPFVTPTENLLMLLAASSRYETTVSGIAQEPHVAQLLQLLREMGVVIKGSGSTLTIIGTNELRGATFDTDPDHVDYSGFAILAAMTTSDLLLRLQKPVTPNIAHMNGFLEQMGVVIEQSSPKEMLIKGSISKYSPTKTFPRADDHGTYKMNPGPWPMYAVDCLGAFIAFSTTNNDPSTATWINNWMYTDGLKYVQTMKEMGAKIAHSDEQRVYVQGTTENPYSLNTSVIAPDVIEGARAVIMCALSGSGTYIVKNAQYVLRRNPEFFDILKRCGADIEIEVLEPSTEDIGVD